MGKAGGTVQAKHQIHVLHRLSGRTLALPVADPRTGEIIAEAGETLTRERAKELDNAGVNEAVLDVDGKQVKVFANNMVDMKNFVDFDPEVCGVTEMVFFPVLCQLLDRREAEGLSDEDFRNCVANGICKVNIFTDINCAAARAAHDGYREGCGLTDLQDGITQAVKEETMKKMRVFGSAGRG